MESSAQEMLASAPSRYLTAYLLNRVVGRLDLAWREELRPYGLTVSRWQMLTILAFYDGSRITALADMVGTEQSLTTRIVDQMERDGLVVRRLDPDDGRARLVWLTDGGRELFEELIPGAATWMDDFTGDLDDDEVDVLADLLTRLLGRVEGWGTDAAEASLTGAITSDETVETTHAD